MLKLECVNCGAPLEITADMNTFGCGYCGTKQCVDRTGGTISLRRVEEAIRAVQRGTDRTAAELAVKRLAEELRAAEEARKKDLATYADALASPSDRKWGAILGAVAWFSIALLVNWLFETKGLIRGGILLLGVVLAFLAARTIVKPNPKAKQAREVMDDWNKKISKLQQQLHDNRVVLGEPLTRQ